MELFTDKAPLYYFVTDENGLLDSFNHFFSESLGYTRDELLGRKIDLIFPIATKIFYQTHLFPLLQMQGSAAEIFISLLAKDGRQVSLLCNINRRQDDESTYFIYAGIAVENRKKFEDELINARKTAEKALFENSALLEAKKELQQTAFNLEQSLATISKQNEDLKQINKAVTHDLQEPLRKLFVFTNLLIEQTAPTGSQSVVYDSLLRAAEKIRLVVNGLQQYVWLIEVVPKYQTIDLNQVLREQKAKVETAFAGLHIHLKADGLPRVHAEGAQMGLLFYQLLANAAHFRKPGSDTSVHVTFSLIKENRFEKVLKKYSYIDVLRIELRDEGMGFDQRFSEQVFELFSTLHPESGLGLGLSLAKKIMENHNGRISAESKPGLGTTIILWLPVMQ